MNTRMKEDNQMKDKYNENLIYVVGLARSGTWMLFESLRISPCIYVPNGMSHYMNKSPKGRNGYKKSIETIRKEWPPILSKETLWADKANDFHGMNKVAKAFPEAKFIFILRSAYQNVTSLAKRSGGITDYNLINQTFSWLNMRRKMFSFEQKHRDKTMFVSFEEILIDPVCNLFRIFEFIGAPISEEVISHGILTIPFGRTNTNETGSGIKHSPLENVLDRRQINLISSCITLNMLSLFNILHVKTSLKNRCTLIAKYLFLKVLL